MTKSIPIVFDLNNRLFVVKLDLLYDKVRLRTLSYLILLILHFILFIFTKIKGNELMAVREILLLGNPALYNKCDPVRRDELDQIAELADDLDDTVRNFREKHGAGRAIAAPQTGVMKRIVHMAFPERITMINPVLENMSNEMFELWDDCMSFPDLLVKVKRHKSCTVRYRDLDWNEKILEPTDDLSELLQHECDHLDGILAVQRAIDKYSFALKSEVIK